MIMIFLLFINFFCVSFVIFNMDNMEHTVPGMYAMFGVQGYKNDGRRVATEIFF